MNPELAWEASFFDEPVRSFGQYYAIFCSLIMPV